MKHLMLLGAMLYRRLRHPNARLWVMGDDGLWHDSETWEVRQP